MTTKGRSKFKDILDQKNNPDPPTVEELEAPGSVKPTRKSQKTPAKSKDPNFTPVTLYLRKDIYQNVQIRLLAMGRRREVSDLVGELLEAWLDKNKHLEI
jgi:hypothetical protein